jgi:hypothetical protein
VSRKDTNYRRSLTVSAITLDAFDFLASWFHQEMWIFDNQTIWALLCRQHHFQTSRLLGVKYFSHFMPILSQKRFSFILQCPHQLLCVKKFLALHLCLILICIIFWHGIS